MVGSTIKVIGNSSSMTSSLAKGRVGYNQLNTEGGSYHNMNNKGSLMSLPINLLMLFITVTFLIALIPGFVEMQDMAQQSDQLNCKGFVYNGNAGDPLSYNATIGTKSSIGCMAIKLYLPYIILGVLIAGVALIFYGKAMGGQDQMQQYG